MLLLDRLGLEAAHPLCGLLLHFVGDMGVGVQGEARAVVPQDAGDRLGICALLDRQGGEGMTQAVEGDVFSDSRLPQQGFMQPPDTVRAVEFARYRGREHDRVARVFGVFLDQ